MRTASRSRRHMAAAARACRRCLASSWAPAWVVALVVERPAAAGAERARRGVGAHAAGADRILLCPRAPVIAAGKTASRPSSPGRVCWRLIWLSGRQRADPPACRRGDLSSGQTWPMRRRTGGTLLIGESTRWSMARRAASERAVSPSSSGAECWPLIWPGSSTRWIPMSSSSAVGLSQMREIYPAVRAMMEAPRVRRSVRNGAAAAALRCHQRCPRRGLAVGARTSSRGLAWKFEPNA